MKTVGFWCIFCALFWFALGEHRDKDWPFQLGVLIVGIVLYFVGHFTGEDT